MIKLQCKCGHNLELPDKLAGQKIRCKLCQKVMRVPRPRTGPRQHDDSDPELLVAGSRPCPGCGKMFPPTVVICTACGVNVETGAMLYASIEEQPAPGEMRAPRESDLEEPEEPPGFFTRLLKKLGLG